MFFGLFSKIHVAYSLNSVQLLNDKEHTNTRIKQCCDAFANAPIYTMLGGDGRLRKTKGHLGF